jgi:hypothetical protein
MHFKSIKPGIFGSLGAFRPVWAFFRLAEWL